jgi:hypothetical protein
VEMAKPAASSFALLIRSPEESLSRDLPSVFCVLVRFLWAFKEAILVLIVIAIVVFLHE